MATQARAESQKGHRDDALVWKAKVNAALGTFRLIAFIHGTIGLVGAVVLTVLLVGLFHLNPLLTLAGSFIGFVILCLGIIPVKMLWKSKLLMAYQEERLYEQANALALEDIQSQLSLILADRAPVDEPPHLRVRLTGVKLLFIRQGNARKAWKIAKYLNRSTSGDPTEICSLASLSAELGYFDEALQRSGEANDKLNAESRQHSPAIALVCLGYITTNLYLHRMTEAEKWLDKLDEFSSTDHTKDATIADELVRRECRTNEFDRAFYLYYQAKYLILKNESGALENLLDAEKIVSTEANQKKLQLFYPGVLTSFGELAMQQSDYKTAATKFAAAHALFEKTQYRGPAYNENKAFAAYAQFKLNGENTSNQIELALRNLEAEVQPDHPRVGAIYSLLSEVQMSFDKAKAQESCEKALAIFKQHYAADDADIRKMELILASIAA
jgi:hypothetical protein